MKRKLVWPILLGIALKALSLVVELCIAMIVLAVGTFIIYKLWACMNIVLPPDSPQKTNSMFYSFYYQHNSSAVASPMIATQSVPGVTGVPLQYGVSSSNGLPWVCIGTNVPAAPVTNQCTGQVIYTLENDSNYMDLVICVGTNLSRIYDDINNDAVTNWPVSVYIQSSTNLTDWTTVLTDQSCALDSVNAFFDTGAPSNHNFYRAIYQ